MKEIILLLVGLATGLAAGWYGRGRQKKPVEFNVRKREEIEKNKEKILEEIKRVGEIANDGVEKILNVSDATATRYLEELEKEGKITQEGQGRGVMYRLK